MSVPKICYHCAFGEETGYPPGSPLQVNVHILCKVGTTLKCVYGGYSCEEYRRKRPGQYGAPWDIQAREEFFQEFKPGPEPVEEYRPPR
jgi:hypothetical protein